jgi:hypothetical protein
MGGAFAFWDASKLVLDCVVVVVVVVRISVWAGEFVTDVRCASLTLLRQRSDSRLAGIVDLRRLDRDG